MPVNKQTLFGFGWGIIAGVLGVLFSGLVSSGNFRSFSRLSICDCNCETVLS